MKLIDPLPASFRRFRDAGGALVFHVFEDAPGDDESTFAAVCNCIPDCNAEALRSLGCRLIDDATFFGASYDVATGNLVKVGSFRTLSGRELQNAKLSEFEGEQIVQGGRPLPVPGTGGDFARAFVEPPYGLQASPREIEALFGKVLHVIMPSGKGHVVRDWSNPELPDVSPYFHQGMEWWGVFLFSIHVPELSRLSVIYGSATD